MSDKAEYYIDTLASAYSGEYADLRLMYFAIYDVFSELLENIVQDCGQLFFSDYAKIEYVINKSDLGEELIHNLHSIRYFTSKVRKKKKFVVTLNEVNLLTKVIAELCFKTLGYVENTFIEAVCRSYTREIPYEQKRANDNLLNDFYDCVVVNKFDDTEENTHYILLRTPENENFTLKLSYSWDYLFPLLRCGNSLNVINVFAGEDDAYIMRKESLVVLEPDMMIDVTEIAGCFSDTDFVYELFFLNLFSSGEVSTKMFIGNLVNFIFDELVIDLNAEYSDIYEKAIRSKPLSLFCLSVASPDELRHELAVLPLHYENLRNVLKDVDLRKASIEPSFISAKYGIQGRLDLLIEYEENENRKDIIELKSGRAPTINKSVVIGSGKQNVQIGMWYNNFAQVTCYNMLLDSAFENRIGNSALLYSISPENAFRNAVNSIFTKWQVVHLRNRIIAEMLAVNEGNTQIFEHLFADEFLSGRRLSTFANKRLISLKSDFVNADDTKRAYFLYFFNFVIREIIAGQIPKNGRNEAFASLWKCSIEEKSDHYSFMSGLKLDEKKSDFSRYHLYFSRHDAGINTFRRGDMVLLYPNFEDLKTPINDQLIKCTIKQIDAEHLVLSLRNKLFPMSVFTKGYESWIVEADRNDSNTKKLFSNLSEFLALGAGKSDLLLGISEPRTEDNLQIEDISELNENQNQIFKNAVRAKDYYLLQGPPGTGKTSFMLKNFVKYEIDNKKYDILLLAYTNRAADEICGVLNKLGKEYDYVRLGNREASVYEDKLIANLAENEDIRDLFKRFRHIRIVVSTVYSAIGNPEIFILKQFGCVIIDEAAQVLEPQIIGIVGKIPKFIMIGDEKQLPAIAVQNPDNIEIENRELLENIELTSPTMSLFERLLRNSIKKNRISSYGILKKQARMHAEIQAFPNKFFYAGELAVMDNNLRQIAPLPEIKDESLEPIILNILSKRLIFINVPAEKLSKVNLREAELTVEIIENYLKTHVNSGENSIGVIAPFRAQCAEISNRLSAKIRSSVTVDTVERFQGSERDIIVYSTAVNYQGLMDKTSSVIQFGDLLIDRKINVAMTRAREQFIMLGNRVILSKNPIYRNLIDFIEERGGLVEIE